MKPRIKFCRYPLGGACWICYRLGWAGTGRGRTPAEAFENWQKITLYGWV